MSFSDGPLMGEGMRNLTISFLAGADFEGHFRDWQARAKTTVGSYR